MMFPGWEQTMLQLSQWVGFQQILHKWCHPNSDEGVVEWSGVPGWQSLEIWGVFHRTFLAGWSWAGATITKVTGTGARGCGWSYMRFTEFLSATFSCWRCWRVVRIWLRLMFDSELSMVVVIDDNDEVEGCREAWGLAKVLLWCYCIRLWCDFCLWIRCKRWRFRTKAAKISGKWIWSCLEFGCDGAQNCSKLEEERNFCKCRSSNSYENRWRSSEQVWSSSACENYCS